MRPHIINAWINDTDIALSSTNLPRVSPRKRKAVTPPISPKRRAVLGELPGANPNRRAMMQDNDHPKVKSSSTPILRDTPKKTPRTPSPTKRQKLHHAREAATFDESLGDRISSDFQDVTPKASNFLRDQQEQSALALRGNPPSQPPQHTYFQALSDSSEPVMSPSRELSSASGTSKRSTSPVKRALALQDVGGGIRFMDLGDDLRELGDHCRDLFLDLRDDASGQQVVPAAVAKRVQGDAPIRPYHIDNEGDDQHPEAAVLSELAAVRKINLSSRRCSRDGESEGEWNTAVHAVLLRLAILDDTEKFGSFPVGFRNVTSAKVDPRWMPRHASGLATPGKMVDFAICLGPDDDEEGTGDPPKPYTCPTLRRVSSIITDTLSSINHTTYPSLRHRPIAISIETKTISRTKEEAQVQLALWVAAQVYRIRHLCERTGCDSDSALTLLEAMAFPLLYVQSATWTVLFARASRSSGRELSLTIYSGVPLGDTSSLIGTYCLIKALRRLREWANGPFRIWWDKVLDCAGASGCSGPSGP